MTYYSVQGSQNGSAHTETGRVATVSLGPIVLGQALSPVSPEAPEGFWRLTL